MKADKTCRTLLTHFPALHSDQEGFADFEHRPSPPNEFACLTIALLFCSSTKVIRRKRQGDNARVARGLGDSAALGSGDLSLVSRKETHKGGDATAPTRDRRNQSAPISDSYYSANSGRRAFQVKKPNSDSISLEIRGSYQHSLQT